MTVEEFLSTHTFPGDILFAKVWGSHSHNTHLETSDTDFLIVYNSPTDKILSLNPPPETIDGKGPDFQAHELKKFCSLLVKGNPAIVECLFTDKMYKFTPEWVSLVDDKKKVLTKRCVQQYLGYAKGQLQRMKNGTSVHTKGGRVTEKWCYHIVRLLYDAIRIVDGNEPLVWKSFGSDERNLLMDIREGIVGQDQVEKIANRMVSEIDIALLTSTIPEEVDTEWLNEWMLNIRRAK